MKKTIYRSLKPLLKLFFLEKTPESTLPAREHNLWGTAGRSEIMISRNLVRMKHPRK